MSATAPPSTSISRRWLPRAQFSLRTFLLAVTTVGIGFPAWYRMPYEETVVPSQELVTDYCNLGSHKDPDFCYSRVTTTWQRQFGGSRLEHGRCRKYDKAGRLKIEQEFRDGKPHGAYRYYGHLGSVVEEGRYEHGWKEGEWIEERDENSERRGPMHRSQRHGEWYSRQWEHERRVTFHEGRVVAVEGVPVDRTFEARFPCVVDEDGYSSRPLLEMLNSLDAVEETLAGYVQTLEQLCDAPVLLDDSVECDSLFSDSWDELHEGDALLILGLPHGLVPVYRYGGICLAPAEGADNWTDPTGVSDLRLPAGSNLALAWNKPVRIEVDELPLAEALAALTKAIALELDTTAINPTLDNPEAFAVTASFGDHPFHQTLGYLLYKTRCRCRLDGETLVILPPEE
jgi:hypothetical protein